jgi:hypothetical protein
MSTMQLYIEQIINKFHEAEKNSEIVCHIEIKEPRVNKIIAYGSFLRQFTSKEIWGVSFEELPEPEMLSNAQMKVLTDVILKLWKAFEIKVYYFTESPMAIIYERVRKTFNDPVFYEVDLPLDIIFCYKYCPYCIFRSNCPDSDFKAIEEDYFPF